MLSVNIWVRAFIFGGLLVYLVYFYWFRGEVKYYIVLYCGSPGIYVYQTSTDDEKGNRFAIVMKSLSEGIQTKCNAHAVRTYDTMETEPGVDKLVRNVAGLKDAIKDAHLKSSLFLYDTAGVRRRLSNQLKWLLGNVWSTLKSSSFLCEREWVRTISGLEEAYFGWIALNFL